MIKKKNKFLFLILIIFFTFALTINTKAQKWYSITENDIAIMSLGLVSGSADGLNQLIVHRKFGEGKQFWDFKVSWKNKYADWDGGDKSARFLGSKTIFVGFTDGFHLTRMIDRTGMVISIGISGGELKKYEKKDRWKVILKKAGLSIIPNRLAFNMIYK
jgi:hypothetical protein